MVAPGAQHRVLFRCGDKEHSVRTADRYAIAGFGCVALAMVGAVLFVAAVVFSTPAASLAALVAAAGAVWSCYLQPLLRRRHLYRSHEVARRSSARAVG